MSDVDIDVEHVVNLLSARDVRCSACGRAEFTVSPRLVALTHYDGGERYYLQRNHPQLMVVCDSCDHTMLFNAGRMGLRDTGPRV